VITRACLECGRVTDRGTRCPPCEAGYQRKRNARRPQYAGGWVQLRKAVIARDNGVCWLCGAYGADTADHVIPAAHGGASTEDNLRAAHRKCNSARGVG
jgi:5-methylcytosine-specific restriction endonuclease McrA